jgi:hypothetical protein
VNGGGGTSEPWALAAIAPSVAVFFDTALVRARGGIAGADARAAAFAAAYDSTVAPLLRDVTEGVPDADGNGRVVVLVALQAGSAFAYPTGYARVDCESRAVVLGEAMSLGGDAFVSAEDRIGTAVSVAAHETAHVVDNAQRYFQAPFTPAFRQDTWWSREGYAVLMQYLWALGPDTPADAFARVFTANRATAARRTIAGTAVGGFCERPDRAVLQTWYRLTGDAYPLACQAVRYALGQAALRQAATGQPGATTRDLMCGGRGSATGGASRTRWPGSGPRARPPPSRARGTCRGWLTAWLGPRRWCRTRRPTCARSRPRSSPGRTPPTRPRSPSAARSTRRSASPTRYPCASTCPPAAGSR